MYFADNKGPDGGAKKVVYYVVESGDTVTSIAAKFDTSPSRLCDLNKLSSLQLVVGQNLKVIEEDELQSEQLEAVKGSAVLGDSKGANFSWEKGYKKIFKRIIGAELVEKSCMPKLMQAGKFEINASQFAVYRKFEARFCKDLHTSIKGTLVATIETLMFSPLEEGKEGSTSGQTFIEMRYEHIRSVAAYHDASVFAFTKRPRSLGQRTRGCPPAEVRNPTCSAVTPSPNPSTPNEGEHVMEPTLLENELFLCCTVEHHRLIPGGLNSPSPATPWARWFIVSKQSVEDLNNFLTDHNLGFASAGPIDNASVKLVRDWRQADLKKARKLSNTMGSLIPHRRTPQPPSPHSPLASPRSHIGRSLSRLIKRTATVHLRSPSAMVFTGSGEAGRCRPLSVGCSEELFFGHTVDDLISDSTNPADDFNSIFSVRSSSSTPSFADEKEVFDMLRQSSLAWEVINEQELLQRSLMREAEKERVDVCATTKAPIPAVLSPPASLSQTCVLSSRAQIQELFEAIPAGAQSFEWSLTFSTEFHGFSLSTLYRRCEDFVRGDLDASGDLGEGSSFSKHSTLSGVQQNQPCVLLIKDTNDYLMGAYLSCHPRLSGGLFYGTGESFVFHWTLSSASLCGEELMVEEACDQASRAASLCFKKYPWSRKNSFFISGEPEVLIIGCSNASSALRIGENLNRGRSQPCETFGNPELTPTGDFFIHTVELWSLS